MCMERLSRDIDNNVLQGEWHPINISRSDPKISHIFFADDLTLFATANQASCNTIMNTLNSFNLASGQKINLSKSKACFSANCQPHQMELISNTLSIKASVNFGKYLRFPIFHKRPTHSDFQFIIDNLHSKIAGWKTSMLNMTRWTTLAKASLNSIPNHVMKYIKLP
ncbi:uncharacterized protein LOC142177235 [Nicotiana tabacum]|uniref:Uncharacterized protein LOC142177235 n=1 Tax=Nicotiana tabacum TaxID=4097 RepID=A0AC58TX66_TOBAC